MKYKNIWLTQYPSLNRYVHDYYKEVIDGEFKLILTKHSRKDVTTTVKKFQSNTLCKCMRQMVAYVLGMSMVTTRINWYKQSY